MRLGDTASRGPLRLGNRRSLLVDAELLLEALERCIDAVNELRLLPAKGKGQTTCFHLKMGMAAQAHGAEANPTGSAYG